jgi:hypothetical protein
LAWLAKATQVSASSPQLLPRFNLVSAQYHPRAAVALKSPALLERLERELTPLWNVSAAMAITKPDECEPILQALRSPTQLALAALKWPRVHDRRTSLERVRAAIACLEQVFCLRWAYWFFVGQEHWPMGNPFVIIILECNAEMLTSISADERPYMGLVLSCTAAATATPSYSVLRVHDLSGIDLAKIWQPEAAIPPFQTLTLVTLGWLPPTLFQNLADPTFRYRPLNDNTLLVPIVLVDAEALDAAT